MLENVTSAFKQQIDVVKDKTSDVADALSVKVTALKEAGADKIKNYMDEISHGLPLIEEAGFKVDGINIDLSLPPDISIGFSKTNEVTSETIQLLIEDNQDKKLLCLILNALQSANNLQSKITMDKFVFAGVSIKLGLPPEVSLKYK
jgi:hypothetical protein